MDSTLSHEQEAGEKTKRVFVSYTTRTPKLQASKINEWINDSYLNLLVWYDHSLTPGEKWWIEICKEIRKCDLFVVIYSAKWCESLPCKKEYEYAKNLHKHILAIQADDFLGSDFQEDQIIQYYKHENSHLIIGGIRKCLEKPPKDPPEKEPDEPPCPLPDLANLLQQLTLDFVNHKDAELTPSELEELATKVGSHWNENYPGSRETIYLTLKNIEKTPSWCDPTKKKNFSKAYGIIKSMLSNRYLPWHRGHLQSRPGLDDWRCIERRNVIDQLTSYWESCDPQLNKKLVVLEGWNPCGKTITVRHWLDELEGKYKDKALSCYCWSFYSEFKPSIIEVDSQKAEDRSSLDYQQYASLDPFFEDFLKYLGCKETLGLGLDKVLTIVKELKEGILKKNIEEEYLGRPKFIIVIDGLDCHQYIGEDLHDERQGQLIDLALQSFLEQIASMQEIFCVITSRVGLKLAASDATIKHIEFLDLEKPEFAISQKDAVEFLANSLISLKEKSANSNAQIKSLKSLSQEIIHGRKDLFNIMLLRYLANYLMRMDLYAPNVKEHLAKIIGKLTGNFADNSKKLFDRLYYNLNCNQRIILQILASVRIPIGASDIQEFYSSTLVPMLLERYNKRSGQQAVNTSLLKNPNDVVKLINTMLQDYSSLLTHIPDTDSETASPYMPQFHADDKLCIHPTQRHYIEDKMKRCFAKNENGQTVSLYHAIHEQLYTFLKNKSTKVESDKTLMYQLAAVRHGCLANKPTDAWKYFWVYVRGELCHVPGNEFGRWSDDLAVLQYFFNKGFAWGHLNPYVDENLYAHILAEVGFDLRVIGRTYESLEVLHRALEEAKQRVVQREPSQESVPSNAEIASLAAGNLSKSYLLLGKIDEAIENARISVEFADKHGKTQPEGDNALIMASRCWLGEALHHGGLLFESDAAFDYALKFWVNKNRNLDRTSYFRSSELILDKRVLLLNGWVERSWDDSKDPIEFAQAIKESLDELIVHTDKLLNKCNVIKRQHQFEFALYQLLKGRTYLIQYDCLQKARLHQKSSVQPVDLQTLLNQASDNLNKAAIQLYLIGHQLYFARVLLQITGMKRREAELLAWTSNTDQGTKQPKDCLTEAFNKLTQCLDIITRGRMMSLEVDYHLENAYCHWASSKIFGEPNHRRKAILAIHDANSIATMYGYRRRSGELHSLYHEIAETFQSNGDVL